MTAQETSSVADLTPSASALVADDITPGGLLNALEKNALWSDAVRFLAHHLPPGKGIQWGAAAVRALRPPDRQDWEGDSMKAVDAWIAAPTDATRRAAKAAFDTARKRTPADLLAFALFCTGSITEAGAPDVNAPPYMAQKMLIAALQMAILSHDPQHADDRYQSTVKSGRALDPTLAV